MHDGSHEKDVECMMKSCAWFSDSCASGRSASEPPAAQELEALVYEIFDTLLFFTPLALFIAAFSYIAQNV